MHRFNGTDYDNVYPTPATHGSTHGSAGSDPLANGSIIGAMLANNTITANQLATSAVGAGNIQSGAVSTTYTATVPTGWSGSTAPYTKAVTITGLLATDSPIVDLVPSSTYTTASLQIEAWGYVYNAVATANTLTLYATDIPTVALPIQLLVVRK